ncbi:MAG: hypothetical protein KGQ93_08955 [Cyanobacteria bacterium REEB459]|nr:hypothetical protein [Cyanobacteria bacterium REEB459]
MHSPIQPLTPSSRLTLLCLSLVGMAGGLLGHPATALANASAVAQSASSTATTPLKPGNLATSSFSIETATKLMGEAEAAIAKQDYTTAEAKLKTARETLNQISTYYQELAQMFIGVDTLIQRGHREKALESAQLRDKAAYQLALVYRAKNQPELAVPLLMEILRSQQPTRELGQRAYQQLFELGFVAAPYQNPAAAPSPM